MLHQVTWSNSVQRPIMHSATMPEVTSSKGLEEASSQLKLDVVCVKCVVYHYVYKVSRCATLRASFNRLLLVVVGVSEWQATSSAVSCSSNDDVIGGKAKQHTTAYGNGSGLRQRLLKEGFLSSRAFVAVPSSCASHSLFLSVTLTNADAAAIAAVDPKVPWLF